MIISTHCSNDPSYELGLNKLELYSVLGIVKGQHPVGGPGAKLSGSSWELENIGPLV
jgi:hypothetical protein